MVALMGKFFNAAGVSVAVGCNFDGFVVMALLWCCCCVDDGGVNVAVVLV